LLDSLLQEIYQKSIVDPGLLCSSVTPNSCQLLTD